MEQSVEFRVTRPKRLIVVEPIIILFVLFAYPLVIISQLFILQRISDDIIASAGPLNISHPNTSFDICTANESDPAYIFNQRVQSEASYFKLISTLVSCSPALIVSLFLGAYSDKAGRKYAIIPPMVGTVLQTLMYVLVVMLDWPIWFLLIGSFFNGLGGYFTTMLMGCFAYISDTTTKEQRRFRITVCEMCMFFSAFLGPVGAGKVLETIGFLYSFLITLGGQVIVLVYTIFFVPETVQRNPQARLIDSGHMKRLIKVFTVKDVVTNRSLKLKILLVAFCFSTTSFLDNIETIYLANRPLCLGPAMIGYYQAAFIGGSTLLAIVVAWLTKYCMTDQGVALIAGIGGMGKNLYMAFVQSVVLIFFTPVFGMFSLLYAPTIRSIISNMVSASEQGAVFGAIGFAEIVCTMIGASIFNPIYSATQSFMTGFVFIIVALFYFIGSVVFLVYMFVTWWEHRPRPYDMLVQSHSDADKSTDRSGTPARSDYEPIGGDTIHEEVGSESDSQ